jgi:hypothetical protein
MKTDFSSYKAPKRHNKATKFCDQEVAMVCTTS